MSIVQNATRVIYAQNLIFGVLAIFFKDEFGAAYSRQLDDKMKNAMTWWGLTMLTAGMAGAAVAQCGDFACRKNLQYGICSWLIALYMAVKIEKSGNNIQMIMHFGFNLILSLYAVYAVPHATKAPKQALESSAVTNAIRFNYVMYMVYGLAATVFQPNLVAAMPTQIYASESLYWWGSAMVGLSCSLMGVAQCGYKTCKKVLQYTMVPAFLGLYLCQDAGYLGESIHRVMAGYCFQIFVAIIACYVIAPTDLKK